MDDKVEDSDHVPILVYDAHAPVLNYPEVMMVLSVIGLCLALVLFALDIVILTQHTIEGYVGTVIWTGCIVIAVSIVSMVFLRYQTSQFAIAVMVLDTFAACHTLHSAVFLILFLTTDHYWSNFVDANAVQKKMIGATVCCMLYVVNCAIHFGFMCMAVCKSLEQSKKGTVS
ncbi:uncharacterized protein DEA37_0014569 [Paragonimus westermani]|uniref:MARVEL domain-containing protein n=1 Tax=Paragonimus westermani TaxID=34504 RepID=A0A5J4NJF1_9TREM|nr:uncharacterized protein DEA37_0014569 [Paragonimus westermani]